MNAKDLSELKEMIAMMQAFILQGRLLEALIVISTFFVPTSPFTFELPWCFFLFQSFNSIVCMDNFV